MPTRENHKSPKTGKAETAEGASGVSTAAAAPAVAYEPFALLGPFLNIGQAIKAAGHASRTTEEAFVQIVCSANNLAGAWRLAEDGMRLLPPAKSGSR
jgi:hypothetical protein